jgi:hypothetical protein
MDSLRTLLDARQLAVITRHGDSELTRIQSIIERKALVEGRADLEELLGQLLAAQKSAPTPKTLDLIGHSTPGDALLQLGDWVIDAASSTVTAYFRELADHDVLPRLGIHALRLLGCRTAETEKGRWTVLTLSEILGLEVYGTNSLLYSPHYDRSGFAYERRYMLVCGSDLRCEQERADRPASNGAAYPRTLDVDALPATPLAGGRPEWPQHLATAEQAKDILNIVRRREGATMPGLLAAPQCEILMPSACAGAYHRAQVLLAGEFIRVYPDGEDRPGVLYPVEDARALRSLVAALRMIH